MWTTRSKTERWSSWPVVLVGVLACSAQVLSADEPQQPNPFDLPRLQQIRNQAVQQSGRLLAAGKLAEAERLLAASVEQLPHDPLLNYNLACAYARQGEKQAALDALQQAIDYGFRQPKQLAEDDDLAAVRDLPRFKQLVEAVGSDEPPKSSGWKFQITPATPSNGQVVIDSDNVAFNPKLGLFQVVVQFPESTEAAISTDRGQVGQLLRQWADAGTAAGNWGDLYDNHDSDHSNMRYQDFPQLTRVEFSAEAKKRNLHHGLQRHFLFNRITIGNSSTALTAGPIWRSQPRFALTTPGGAQFLYLQYRANQLYFYPEHRDHDVGHNGDGGFGDVYPANTPYMVISQGSSGSDRVFMNATAATLAAFRPEVKQKLAQKGMLMPTVQMLLRRTNKQVTSNQDYLTGKAHPTVFDGKQLNPPAMARTAQAMQADSLPPLVTLNVVKENEGKLGVDYFDAQPREKLFDTPCAIARVVKSSEYERRMIVSADGIDLNNKPLEFHWVVLRGDGERIDIRRLDNSGSIAEIVVPYHRRRPVSPGSNLESNRVDIGVFVSNGDYYSPPSFISFYYLDNEFREYDEQQRIKSIDYTDPAVRGNYVDPLLDSQKDWRDEYRYGADGELQGWTRIRETERTRYTADGKRIIATDAAGNATETVTPTYKLEPLGKGKSRLVEE